MQLYCKSSLYLGSGNLKEVTITWKFTPFVTNHAPNVVTIASQCYYLYKEVQSTLPDMLFALSILIEVPSSRFQVTTGVGLPVAWHSKVTSLPSVRTLSLLLWASSIRGGTEKERRLLLTNISEKWQTQTNELIWIVLQRNSIISRSGKTYISNTYLNQPCPYSLAFMQKNIKHFCVVGWDMNNQRINLLQGLILEVYHTDF